MTDLPPPPPKTDPQPVNPALQDDDPILGWLTQFIQDNSTNPPTAGETEDDSHV